MIHKKKKLKLSTKLFIIIGLIIFLTCILLNYYYNKINPKIVEVSQEKIEKLTENYLTENIGYNLLKDIKFGEILEINKNSEGEILYLDYNLEKSYKVLQIITDEVIRKINELENGKVDVSFYDDELISNNHGLMLKVPLLIASSNALLANMGPKIYIKINFDDSILTNIKSKVTNYGMNNALIELYVTIKIKHMLLSPVVNKKQTIKYNVLVAAKVINGRVPEFYGGELIKDSTLYNQ